MESMNAQYFIDLFLPIPESEWGTGNYVSADGTKKCALGHCGVRDVLDTAEDHVTAGKRFFALTALFNKKHLVVPHINDGLTYADNTRMSLVPAYQELGSTPKKRILAVLHQLKKAGY